MDRQEWLEKFLFLADRNRPAKEYRRLRLPLSKLRAHVKRIPEYREELKRLQKKIEVEVEVLETHSFVLILELDEVTIDLADALFESCSDGTISQSSGNIFMEFSKEATSLNKAVRIAIEDLQNLGIKATLWQR